MPVSKPYRTFTCDICGFSIEVEGIPLDGGGEFFRIPNGWCRVETHEIGSVRFICHQHQYIWEDKSEG